MTSLGVYTWLVAVALLGTCCKGYGDFQCYDILIHSCRYICETFFGWFHGILNDGAPCWRGGGPANVGRCYRGFCRRIQGPRPPRPQTCDGRYPGPGYAPGCQYSCSKMADTKGTRNYKDGTPCINLNSERKPLGAAGICKQGVCIEYDDMEVAGSLAAARVFSGKYQKCPDRLHRKAITLHDCHYYCKIKGRWYFGIYMSNATCQHPETKQTGWCCMGECQRSNICGGLAPRLF
ncbi:uncharacterized protein LOC144141883 isoform X1 [Haemaphysalis longicornis]